VPGSPKKKTSTEHPTATRGGGAERTGERLSSGALHSALGFIGIPNLFSRYLNSGVINQESGG